MGILFFINGNKTIKEIKTVHIQHDHFLFQSERTKENECIKFLKFRFH